MASNVVTILDTTQGTVRPSDDIRTNVEHGCLLIVLLKEIVECIVGAVGTIIEGLITKKSDLSNKICVN